MFENHPKRAKVSPWAKKKKKIRDFSFPMTERNNFSLRITVVFQPVISAIFGTKIQRFCDNFFIKIISILQEKKSSGLFISDDGKGHFFFVFFQPVIFGVKIQIFWQLLCKSYFNFAGKKILEIFHCNFFFFLCNTLVFSVI